MTWFIDPDACQRVFAAEYLRAFPARGEVFRAADLGLEFYALNDCLCLGKASQVIAPIHGRTLPFVFKEAGPYLSSETPLPGQAAAALAGNGELLEIDEAAPFFPPGASNFWHWTTESLPKLLALESLGYTGPYIVPRNSPVVHESLDLHGIAAERRLPGGPRYRVRRLVLPPRLSGFLLPENLPLTAFLRDQILSRVGTLPGSKRCYIRRIGRRRILNEPQMLELLDEFGFETMVPEDLTLAEQWRYMTNCACSLMPHGANNTLTLTQPPGSAFIEFFSNRYINYSSLYSIRLLRLRYLPLVEELDLSWYPDKTTSVYDHLAGGIPADITVHLIHLRLHLETILGAQSDA